MQQSTPGAWHEKARELRADGLTLKEIATRFGVTNAAVWKALHPDRAREYNRSRDPKEHRRSRKAWEDRNRHPCADCGTLVFRSPRCRPCDSKRRGERRQQIAGMYRAGAPLKEIAAAFGTNVNAIGSTLAQMRADGFDLPYRYAGTNEEGLGKIRESSRQTANRRWSKT